MVGLTKARPNKPYKKLHTLFPYKLYNYMYISQDDEDTIHSYTATAFNTKICAKLCHVCIAVYSYDYSISIRYIYRIAPSNIEINTMIITVAMCIAN